MERKNGSFRFFGSLISALLLGLLFTQSLSAQVDAGTILGTVKDQTGAVVPGVKVTLTDEGTNFTVTTTSGADGGYVFTPVKIGTYTVGAEAAGFAKAVQTHLALSINQSLVADLTLKPGAMTQTVEVTAAAPAMQTQDASVGQVVNSQSVNNLPLNGRNFTFLAQIVAGVNTPQADTRGNAASGAFAANGLRPAQNNYLLNGIDNNSDTVDFLNGTNFVVLPPIDAIQEFKVQTSDYSAQYGRSGAAILNATIKSGTNQIHGDVWEFFRNDKLDSANFFEDAARLHKGEYRQNQYGFTIGGPVVIPNVYNGKNKLFFFGDFEGLRRRQGSIFSGISVPTALERSSGFTNFADIITGQAGSAKETDALGRSFPAGTVLDPATTRAVTAGTADPVTGLTPAKSGFVRDPFYTGSLVGVTDFTGFCPSNAACKLNLIPAGRIDQNAVKLLGLYPAPLSSGLTSNFSSNPVLKENREAFDTRLDFNQSDRNQLFGTFSYVTDPQFIPSPFGGIADGGAFQQGNQAAITILGALSYTHIFSPTLVNEARIGENRIHTSRYGPVATQYGLPANYGISTATIPQCCNNGGIPAIGFSGLSTIGSNNFLPSDEISQTTQLTDNLTKIFGKHSFKSGIEYQHVKYSTFQPAYSHGQFNYNGSYTGIVNGASGNTGLAQFVILPCGPGSTPGGTPTGCPSVPGAIPFVGGMNGYLASNLGFTDDGKNYWGAYFQDDWKYNSKLTLNLGLRWDYFGQTYEHFGAQANIVPGAPCHPASTAAGCAQFLIPTNRNSGFSPSFLALTAQDGIAIVPTSNKFLGNSQLGNFGPRLGLAYQISNKLVVRGGAGMFYGGFENRGYGPNIGENYPFQYNFSFNNPNGEAPISAAAFSNFAGTPCANAMMFETGFDCTPIQTSRVNASGLGLEGLQFNYLTPYTMGWNLTFEYQFSPTLTLTMGYVGNGARHLEVGSGANRVSQILPPGLNQRATSSPGVGLYVNYPDFATGFSYRTSNGDSYYNSLQTTLQEHYANGLNFLLTYTYSRCRSDAGDSLNGGSVGGRSGAYVPNVGIQYDFTDCSYDIRNVVHFSGGYDLPFGQGKKYMSSVTGAANQIVSGWSTQWSATVQGGQPLNIGCSVGTTTGLGCVALLVPGQDRHGTGGVNQFLNPAAFTQPCPPPGSSQPARCVSGITGIGLLGGAEGGTSGPGYSRVDFSIFKDFHLTERARLQFRTEIFNILNHPTFNAPGFGGNGVVSISGSTDFLSNKFGQIGSTRSPFNDPRQIQMALKLYW